MGDINAFRNRLTKNARHFGKWAKRQGISCYRIYDCDIPEFPVSIDVYEEWAHLQEYDTRWKQTPEEHAGWVTAIQTATTEILSLPASQVIFKLRSRQRGTAQYEKTGETGKDTVVTESGHKFIVNLAAYLDTGLFLDHRLTRQMVESRSKGKRFLNLFAYTGSFTVYAACGGATSSVTVDLSNTYQDWTRRNLELNNIDLKKHRLVREDVFRFLNEGVSGGQQFDLIVMDPPSFSNSKKMEDILDIQRDHVKLIQQCMKLLSRDGELFFSNNLRTFKLDSAKLDAYEILDITRRTIPEDFRNQKIHQCWIISHKKQETS